MRFGVSRREWPSPNDRARIPGCITPRYLSWLQSCLVEHRTPLLHRLEEIEGERHKGTSSANGQEADGGTVWRAWPVEVVDWISPARIAAQAVARWSSQCIHATGSANSDGFSGRAGRLPENRYSPAQMAYPETLIHDGSNGIGEAACRPRESDFSTIMLSVVRNNQRVIRFYSQRTLERRPWSRDVAETDPRRTYQTDRLRMWPFSSPSAAFGVIVGPN